VSRRGQTRTHVSERGRSTMNQVLSTLNYGARAAVILLLAGVQDTAASESLGVKPAQLEAPQEGGGGTWVKPHVSGISGTSAVAAAVRVAPACEGNSGKARVELSTAFTTQEAVDTVYVTLSVDGGPAKNIAAYSATEMEDFRPLMSCRHTKTGVSTWKIQLDSGSHSLLVCATQTLEGVATRTTCSKTLLLAVSASVRLTRPSSTSVICYQPSSAALLRIDPQWAPSSIRLFRQHSMPELGA